MIEQIIKKLESYPNNLTARRWLQDERAPGVIFNCAKDWNIDHAEMGYPDMMFTIEEHVEIYLDTPDVINNILNENSPQD